VSMCIRCPTVRLKSGKVNYRRGVNQT
jgi:hypothetical protein